MVEMDQVDRQFSPYVLAVHTGTRVLFVNNDSVAHQVYSFSPAKRFELALYHGKPREPVVFDQPGIVTVGCNIHDNMVGYLYVTDAPWFGTTGNDGVWRSALTCPPASTNCRSGRRCCRRTSGCTLRTSPSVTHRLARPSN